MSVFRIFIVVLISLLSLSVFAQEKKEEHLKYVLVLTRHGVRSPTWPSARLNEYSAEPWPKWDVPKGNLTPHGAKLMEQMGAYHRLYLASQGLLAFKDCSEAKHLLFWADTDQRTLATAQAFALGLFPGCSVPVGSKGEGQEDPLFHPVAAGMTHPPRELAAAAVLGRIGNTPESYVAMYRAALQTLQAVLSECAAVGNCREKDLPKRNLLSDPIKVEAGTDDHLVDITGALSTASTLAENLQLEYAGGFQGRELGWGRLTEEKLLQIMSLHTAYTELARETPFVAQAQASYLAIRILDSLQQAIEGKPVAQALGDGKDKFAVLVGHDTNISNFAGMLNLSWVLPGYVRNDVPPGAEIVFELWSNAQNEFRIRAYVQAQSLEQMQKAMPLNLDAPPEKAKLFMPGCSTGDENYSCSWQKFREMVLHSVDPAATGNMQRAAKAF